MADIFSKAKRSEIMSRIRGTNTKVELKLKAVLEQLGFQYHPQGLQSADFANRKLKIVVYADGCFWHMCPLHGSIPKSNKDYWQPKLERNRRRDGERTMRLVKGGWRVVRVWEHTVMGLKEQELIDLMTGIFRLPYWKVIWI